LILASLVGFLFGFIGAMPIAGPVAVLVLAHALEGRPHAARSIGLGCAVAESIYAALAFLGFSGLLVDCPLVLPVSRAVAATILFGLAFHFLRRQVEFTPAFAAGEALRPVRHSRHLLTGFSVTALNPTLLATWTAATTTLFATGLVELDPALSLPFGIAVWAGITTWYLVLVALVEKYQRRLSLRALTAVIRAMGVLLVGLGIWFAWRFADSLAFD
jgi:threonine/homoserine/homoserine lactone efflux protein